jgi:hypothetical protein
LGRQFDVDGLAVYLVRVGFGWGLCVDALLPHINGIGRPWIGFWPPYEALENEGSLLQLRERQLVDLRLAIVTYLGHHKLPGEVGADLMHRLLFRAADDLRLETSKDWEGFIEWLGEQTHNQFDGMMRECFASGLYSAQLQ